MLHRLTPEEKQKIHEHSIHLQNKGQLGKTRNFIQHGHTSVFAHVHLVAGIALWLNRKLHLKADPDKLIRSSLLHDYFLYDWHDADHDHPRPHGFTHPRIAMENAHRDYGLHHKEKDAILRHMFPLTIKPPRHREGWIVTTADKISAFSELSQFWQNKLNKAKRRLPFSRKTERTA